MILTLTTHIRPLLTAGSQWGRPARFLIVILYTTLLTIGLVQSSANPLIGPSAPEDFNFFWEMLLTTGHVVGFGGLVILLWWALTAQSPPLWALLITVIFALILGIVTESLQNLVPDRSASLFDLLCDWGVVLAVGYVIYRRNKRPLSV
jgi:VanZ family protein